MHLCWVIYKRAGLLSDVGVCSSDIFERTAMEQQVWTGQQRPTCLHQYDGPSSPHRAARHCRLSHHLPHLHPQKPPHPRHLHLHTAHELSKAKFEGSQEALMTSFPCLSCVRKRSIRRSDGRMGVVPASSPSKDSSSSLQSSPLMLTCSPSLRPPLIPLASETVLTTGSSSEEPANKASPPCPSNSSSMTPAQVWQQ